MRDRPSRLAVPLIVVVLLAALAAAGAASGAPGARAGGIVRVGLGDTADIVGTRMACFPLKSEGKRGVACFEAEQEGLIPGTFGAAIAEDGVAVVHRVQADRSPKRVFKRTLAGSAGKGRYLKLNVGDVFAFAEAKVVCEVVRVRGGVAPLFRGIKVACWRGTPSTGPEPRSFGIAVSDKFAGVFRFDRQGKPGPDVFVRAQPS